jgi:hypothetical protein
LIASAVYLVGVGLLLRLIFAAADGLSGHVARIVMELPRLLFARLLLVWILVVGHGCSTMLNNTMAATRLPKR